jgi:hypothetical protein
MIRFSILLNIESSSGVKIMHETYGLVSFFDIYNQNSQGAVLPYLISPQA